ncbi:MAG: dTDP-glucose 4,6-dehydratase [Betaproteobacteria bacterium]|nr:dTDP-glucose 4,6-dehydratase [Betaproteobacteria bacterium]
MILVTGGAGFIGSNFVLDWITQSEETVCVLDCLNYAGNLANLESVSCGGRFDGQVLFSHTDLRAFDKVNALIAEKKPRAIVHFAAESHVDRSIDGPDAFIQTNIVGTFNLLQAARSLYADYVKRQSPMALSFRFLHVSTDEVYGSLDENDPAFTERNPYAPNSPYSASKAASDHLVRAWHHTYGLPTLTTNCSNNYGPFQFPEKLIPLIISHAIGGKALPVYGDGKNRRDWLYVKDHCRAIRLILEHGTVGEVYNIGGQAEIANIEVVRTVCRLLDKRRPRADGQSYEQQIEFVQDRPGHDKRYAMNIDKIRRELGWQPTETFESGLQKTIDWYLDHQTWVGNLQGRRGLS